MKRLSMHARKGVTFIELSLVLLIIGLLTVIGTPQFSVVAQARKTRNATLMIADYVQFIRSTAINEGRSASFTIDAISDRFDSPDVEFPDQAGRLLSLELKLSHERSIELVGDFDGETTLSFDFEGTPTVNGRPLGSGSITIWSPAVSYRINVDPGTGMPQILERDELDSNKSRSELSVHGTSGATGKVGKHRMIERSIRLPDTFGQRPRPGYTFIELIGAMAAAVVMLVTLASAVAVSTSLVEPNEQDGRRTRDRVIADRLSNDLRYATSIDTRVNDGFNITRQDSQGMPISLRYQSGASGLTRTVTGSSVVRLDPVAPSISQTVDGYSAPTDASGDAFARVFSVSTAISDGVSSSSLAIETPPGARAGDLLVLVSAYRDSSWLSPASDGWNAVAFQNGPGITLQIHRRVGEPSVFGFHKLTYEVGAGVAVAMLAIEKSRAGSPFEWLATDSGMAIAGVSTSFPGPIENPGAILASSLQLQLFASTGAPWIENTLGIASYSDRVSLTGSAGTSAECSLAIATRIGAAPLTTTTPRLWHQQSSSWVALALQVEGAP